MVSHSSHTNHELLILVIQVTDVSFVIESFEEKCPISKNLMFFFSLIWPIFYKLSYEKICQKQVEKM